MEIIVGYLNILVNCCFIKMNCFKCVGDLNFYFYYIMLIYWNICGIIVFVVRKLRRGGYFCIWIFFLNDYFFYWKKFNIIINLL